MVVGGGGGLGGWGSGLVCFTVHDYFTFFRGF